MKTIGIVVVAFIAALGAPWVISTSPLRPTKSAARAASRSRRSSAQRYSIATFCPSIQPVSPRPRRNAATRDASGELIPRKPITGIAFCCAWRARDTATRRPAAGSARGGSFDDLVGAGEDRGRDGEAERFGGVEVDDQLEGGRLLDR